MKNLKYILLLPMLVSPWLCADDVVQITPEGQITVTGEAEVKVVPDEVVLTLGVETYNKDLALAKLNNDEAIARILAVAKDQKIKSEHIKTDFIQIEPVHQVNSGVQGGLDRNVVLGYVVRKTVVITLKDIASFEAVLSSALKAGANYVHGVQFQTTELRKYRDQARALAVKAAKEKATALANELGQKVGIATMVNEQYNRWWPSYGRYWGDQGGYQSMRQNVIQSAASGDAAATAIAPGQISVTASVHVVFQLLK